MAHKSRIELVAFDLGGVLIRVDKRVDRRLFETQSFDMFTIGRIRPGEFFSEAAMRTQRRASALRQEFESMVSAVDVHEELLGLLTRPFTFWSNINSSHFKYLLKRYPALRSYDANKGALSFQLKLRKPDREFYLAGLQAAALEPSSILFLDDTDANIQGARDLGIDAHQVTTTNGVLELLFRYGLISKPKGASLLA